MRDALERAGATVGLALGGLVGSAAVALALLPVTRVLQPPVYRALYLALGPSDATAAATLAQFLAVAAVAVTAPALVAHRLTGGRVDARAVAAGFGVAALAAVAAGAFLLTGAVPVTAVFLLVAVAVLAVAVALRHRYGVRSGGVTALAGAMPTAFLLLLLAGFGLGWGWGYVVTADAVPADTVDASAAVDFDDAPEVRDDLFAADACEGAGSDRSCYLQLRGYEHERRAARFLARHGVHCPIAGGDPGTLFVEHDGTVYRVTCQSHGD